MGIMLDPWETPMPAINSGSPGNIRYDYRLIWCSMVSITESPFYCRELQKLVEKIYNVKLHHFTIAWFLKSLEKLGYIERISLKADTAQYQYKFTEMYENLFHKQTLKEEI